MRISHLFFFFLLTGGLLAQITPATAIAEMDRGINLGNTLEPPQEGAWNNGPAQESYFDAYVAAGFTNVRIPVRWDEHTQNFSPYTIDASWMDRVEEVVDWGLSRGLYITLNGHHEDWLKNDYSATNRARYDNIWRQIITRFKDKSDKLLYEIINEPNGLTVQQVDDLNARILGIIRAEEPTRLVIFSGNMYSNAEQLIQAAVPPNDDYLIGYYHSYDPWPFAGEANGTWGTAFDYQQMASKFQRAKTWSEQKNIPVYVSEFNARIAADYNSRMRWLGEYMGLADKHGFATSAWDDGGMFKILNRNNNTWPEVKDILVHGYQDSPNNIFSSAVQDGNDQTIALVEWENRLTGNDSIILERSVGASGNFSTLATLAPNATEFRDADVTDGATYTYRMYTTAADGRLVHGYPTRLRLTPTTGGVQSSFTGTAIPIPGTLQVEDYDNGGEGIAYHDNDAQNQGGGYRLDEGVDIGGGPGNGFVLGYVANGEWLEFTVDVAQTGTYRMTANVASADAESDFQISFPNDATATFSTPLTGDWNNYQEISANSTIDLAEGEQVVRLTISGSRAFNVDDIVFTLESTATEAEAIRAGFTISPNPADEVLSVNLPSAFAAGGQLILFNAAGAQIAHYPVAGNTRTIDVSQLPAGSYLLRLTNAKRRLMRRLIIR